MNHTYHPDLIGRLAIRLGRAFRHKWATEIPRDAVWNWFTAEKAIRSATNRTVPNLDGYDLTYNVGQTHWLLTPDDIVVRCDDRELGTRCRVEARVDETLGPVLEVWLASLSGFDHFELGRFDKVLTSLSEGPWKPLHRLTPLAVIVQALPEYLPTEPSMLVYTDGRIISGDAELNAAMARAGTRFFTQWERMVTR